MKKRTGSLDCCDGRCSVLYFSASDAIDGNRTSFSMLRKDHAAVMYQSFASAEEERMTFYGASEIFVRAPCGTVVGFAEMQENG